MFLLLGMFSVIKHCPYFIISIPCLFLKDKKHSQLASFLNWALPHAVLPSVFNLQDDILTVIRRVDENWAEGMLGDKIGIFPISYVEVRKRT